MTRRGFNLAELMVAVAILGLITGLAVLPLRRGNSFARANPDAVAAVVVNEFRSARLKAISKSMPVAVVIPSANGTRAHAQSLYILEGYLPAIGTRDPLLPPEPPPKVARVIDFSKEYPGVYLYAGGWDVDSAALNDPALTPAIGDALGVSLENWTKPTTSKDFQFVFLPDGHVVTNDLPHYDGSFHILVAANLAYTTTAAPSGTASMTTPPGYFQLTGANKPATISISLQGGVTSVTGLVAAQGVTDCGAGQPALSPAGALVPVQVSNTPPQVADVTVLPPPNPALSGGFDATVRPDGFLTLKVRIVDAQGDQVSCQWNQVVVAGPGVGTFTVPPGNQSIEYDTEQGCWVASVVWQPPVNAVQGNQFQLSATVVDSLGAAYTLTGNAAIDVETRSAGRFFFCDNGYICTLNGDGTSIRRLTRGTDPEVSPDGSKVAFLSGTNVCVMNSDGSQVKTVAAGDFGSPTWSPDGLYLAFDETGTNVRFLRLSDQQLSSVLLAGSRPRWSSNDQLAYQQVVGSANQLVLAPIVANDLFLPTPVAPTPTPLVLPAPYDTVSVSDPAWSSQGGYLTFSTAAGIYSCDVAGTTVEERYIPAAGETAQRPWMMVGEPATKLVLVEGTSANAKLQMYDVDLSSSTPAGSPVLLRSGKLSGSCSWGP